MNSSGDDVDAPQEEEGKATRIRFHGGFFAFIFLLFRSECSTISVVVGKGDCLSPITRIKGYPWLVLNGMPKSVNLFIYFCLFV